jgi:GPH family glycoside/pentoside/hexuronide:cation symporter
MTETAPTKGKKLSFFRKLAYAIGNFGVSYGPATFSFLPYFYYGQETDSGEKIVYVSIASYSVIWALANWVNAFTDPIVGYLSDKTRHRWGRRRPWVIVGAPLLAICFYFCWSPVTETPSFINSLVLFLSLLGFWLFFTVVVAPYLSLLPEITPYDNERVHLSAMMSMFGDVFGTLAGSMLMVLAPVAAGILVFMDDGFRALALIGAIAICVFFILCVVFVKETYVPPPDDKIRQKGAIKKALKEFFSTFKNHAFPPYLVGVFFYRMSIMIILSITPFVATKIIGARSATETDLKILTSLGAVTESGTPNWEQASSYLMALVLLGALLFFIPVSLLAGKTGKRILFILSLTWLGIIMILMSTVGHWTFISPMFQGVALFILAAIPVAIALVVMRPLLADIIDADEGLTGKRREGVYNGMEGFIMKMAAGLGPFLVGMIFAAFGNTAENPTGILICGPVAGVCLLIAAFAFTKYPIKK